jgi:hypothetical protein
MMHWKGSERRQSRVEENQENSLRIPSVSVENRTDHVPSVYSYVNPLVTVDAVFREMRVVYYANIWGWGYERYLNVPVGGSYSYHCTLQG